MSTSFLLRQCLHVLTPDRNLYFPYGRLSFLRSMGKWHWEAFKRARCQMSDVRCQFTVILQNYKRPWNIEPMVRMLLRFENVERVIVSNNNPTATLQLSTSDPRVHILHQSHQCPASMFAMIALEEAKKGASYFLCIDDDLLLFPSQIETLMRAFVADPSVPHGLVGQNIANDGQWVYHLTGDRSVDILNRVYAFTADHVRRYAELLDVLGYRSTEEKAQLPFGSDIVLSRSGKGKPCIHQVGRLLSCPTNAKPGIARFKDEGFNAFRSDLWQKVQKLSPQ